MSNSILIIGESGSGKSSSLRHINTEETFIINVLDKPLPFKGYKKNYHRLSPDGMTGNSYSSLDHAKIANTIALLNVKRTDFKTLVIDDFQYTMADEFMNRALEKGYDKFSEIGRNAYILMRMMNQARNDLTCVVLTHSDTDINGRVKCKSIGKMLDDKVVIEGMFTIVLHALVVDGKYKFLTQSEGPYIAKSPMGMFSEKLIDNDLTFVLKKMHEYFEEDVIDVPQ